MTEKLIFLAKTQHDLSLFFPLETTSCLSDEMEEN